MSIPFTSPLRLPYTGASTIEDAEGRLVAECPNHETAAALIELFDAVAALGRNIVPSHVNDHTVRVVEAWHELAEEGGQP